MDEGVLQTGKTMITEFQEYGNELTKKKQKKLTETNVTNEKLRTKTETSSPQLHISWPTQSP